MPEAVELENRKEYTELLQKTPVVILLAHANYSAPSKTFKSEFIDLAAAHGVDGKFVLAWFNAFDADDINEDLLVRTFPAYFIYNDGKEVKRELSSTATKQALEADIKEFKPS